MHTIIKNLDVSTILKGLGILIALFLIGGAMLVWQSPSPPPPLPETHATPLTPNELVLFQQWVSWTNHLLRLFTIVGISIILILSICVITKIAARGILIGGMIMLLVLGTSFYLVNSYLQDEASRMVREMQERG